MRAVLCDMGGTFIRWACGPAEVCRAAAERGVELTAEAAGQWWRDAHRAPGHPCMGEDFTAERYRNAVIDYYRSADEIAPGMSSWVYERAVDPDCYEALPGALAALTELRWRGFRLAVISDTGFDIRPALKRLGMLEHFDVVLLSYEELACKPDPRLFLTVCERLGVQPCEALMVGDDPVADGGAAAVGIPVLLQPRNSNYEMLLRVAANPTG